MKKTSRWMMMALVMANFAGSAALADNSSRLGDTTSSLGCPAIGGTTGRKAVESTSGTSDSSKPASTAASGDDSSPKPQRQ